MSAPVQGGLTVQAAFDMAVSAGRRDKFDFRIPGTSQSHAVECAVLEPSEALKFAHAVLARQSAAPVAATSEPVQPTQPSKYGSPELQGLIVQHASGSAQPASELTPDLESLPRYSREMCGGQHGRIGFEDFFAVADVERLFATQAATVTGAQAEASEDSAILDWLEMHCVNVRIPLRYGSRDLFWATPEDREGDTDGPSDLRSQARSAIQAMAPVGVKSKHMTSEELAEWSQNQITG